jgi:hypothetical protein
MGARAADNFLEAEGVFNCSKCGVHLCRHCVIGQESVETAQCIPCLRAEVMGVGDLTEAAMRETLKEHEVQIPATATYRQLMLLVDRIVDKEVTTSLHGHSRSVDFPCLPSSVFDSEEDEDDSSKIDTIMTLNVSELSRVVRNESICLDKLLAITRRSCCALGCRNTDQNCAFTSVQRFPPELPKGASKKRQITRQSKLFTRREMLDRLGLGHSDREYQDLRFCECHPVEEKWQNSGTVFPNESGERSTKAHWPKKFRDTCHLGFKGEGT